ncbi:DUF6228 family protein [Sphaerisporangium sp. NBC_01403]|uniref:DUF6228 family protein n=1 Tax=Sphaerisporangium sp. NBC_01403 TaxID=2903599 RepID=UPI00386E6F4B
MRIDPWSATATKYSSCRSLIATVHRVLVVTPGLRRACRPSRQPFPSDGSRCGRCRDLRAGAATCPTACENTLRATFHSGGHVELTWTLRRWSSRQDSWEASITTWLDAGEQLTTLAADVRAYLHRQS